jgi:hypothetical protein
MSHGEIFQTNLLYEPQITFTSVHGNSDLSLSHAPCSLETARSWIKTLEEALGARVLKIDLNEHLT